MGHITGLQSQTRLRERSTAQRGPKAATPALSPLNSRAWPAETSWLVAGGGEGTDLNPVVARASTRTDRHGCPRQHAAQTSQGIPPDARSTEGGH